LIISMILWELFTQKNKSKIAIIFLQSGATLVKKE
jgi:hypothetical protein